MKDPVDHILRPQLPWRSGSGITECGLDAAKAPTLSREQYLLRLKDMGQQRTAILTCMTCLNTAQRWHPWYGDPRQALGREIEWETGWHRGDRGDHLRDELLAIEALIKAHPEEFAAGVVAAQQRREWLQQKATLAAAKSRGRA